MSQSAEAAALVAIMDEDPGEARRILEDFFPTELRMFSDHVEQLSDLIDEVRREKSAR